MIRLMSKCTAVLAAAALAFTLAGCDNATEGDAGTDNSGFVGTFKTQDTQGNPMSITLDEEGSASGERGGEQISGSWKDEGGTAVITWSWQLDHEEIAKDGDSYSKSAYQDGTQTGEAVAAEKRASKESLRAQSRPQTLRRHLARSSSVSMSGMVKVARAPSMSTSSI